MIVATRKRKKRAPGTDTPPVGARPAEAQRTIDRLTKEYADLKYKHDLLYAQANNPEALQRSVDATVQRAHGQTRQEFLRAERAEAVRDELRSQLATVTILLGRAAGGEAIVSRYHE